MIKKPLLIHIPKTGGVSIQKTKLVDNEDWVGHKRAVEVENLSNYFSFAFVRNPYEKVLSSYFYWISKKSERFVKFYEKYPTFREFILDYKNSTKLEKHHFDKTCWDYVTDETGNIIVDFIGRFENINEDFIILQQICDVDNQNKKTLEWFNKSDHGDWRSYYDDEIAEIVYENWKKDFINFNYDKNSYKKPKMKKIALMTVLFDFPNHYEPSFYKNALNYFDKEDIHVVRHTQLINPMSSYYEKLFFYKTVKLLEYLEKNILGKYEYILFLDGTDTNFIKSPENVIEKFLKLNCSIVMGAEMGLWPPTNYTHLYEKKRVISESKYLNSGTYFGHTDKIVFHLRDIIEKEYQTGIDDQGRWTIQYLLNDDIIIDQEKDFFFSTYNTGKYVKIENYSVELINSDAFVIHDNGPHNDDTIKLTQFLNENN